MVCCNTATWCVAVLQSTQPVQQCWIQILSLEDSAKVLDPPPPIPHTHARARSLSLSLLLSHSFRPCSLFSVSLFLSFSHSFLFQSHVCSLSVLTHSHFLLSRPYFFVCLSLSLSSGSLYPSLSSPCFHRSLHSSRPRFLSSFLHQ